MPEPTSRLGRVVPRTGGTKRIDFICQNLNLGVTAMTMLLDGEEVEVIAYVITEETTNADGDIVEEYAIEPIAVFVDDAIEARLAELPQPGQDGS